MVKNKNYNHPEVAVLRENDLLRMKVKFPFSEGNYSQANEIITLARAKARWRREGVQVVLSQSQAGGNAKIIVIKEKEASFRWVRKGEIGKKWGHKQQGDRIFAWTIGWCQDNEQNGSLCKGSDDSITPTGRKKERLVGLQSSREKEG